MKLLCLVHSKEHVETCFALSAEQSQSGAAQLLSDLKYDDRPTINILAKAPTPAKMNSGVQTPLLMTTPALIVLLNKC